MVGTALLAVCCSLAIRPWICPVDSAVLGQLAHFIGHHGKTTAHFTGARRFDGCVERQQVGLSAMPLITSTTPPISSLSLASWVTVWPVSPTAADRRSMASRVSPAICRPWLVRRLASWVASAVRCTWLATS
jgi:hypothetical protein